LVPFSDCKLDQRRSRPGCRYRGRVAVAIIELTGSLGHSGCGSVAEKIAENKNLPGELFGVWKNLARFSNCARSNINDFQHR